MQLKPIVATLRKHKLTASLLVLQVAFTCAIVCNAMFLIAQRIERINVPSGLAESSLSLVTVDDLDAGTAALSLHQADLAALRRLPGVQSAALINHVPFSNSQSTTGVCGSLGTMHAAIKANTLVKGCSITDRYSGGPGTLRTLGLQLVAGRAFQRDEYVPAGSSKPTDAVIITQALAKKLYPSDPTHAVGHQIYHGLKHSARIVGVIARLHRARIFANGNNDAAMLLPKTPSDDYATFALRSLPSDRTRVMKQAVAALAKHRPQRQISASNAKTYTQIRAAYFSRDTTMIHLLLAATLGLLFVTALGIAGLASFWVQQRTRSIGIRRAIGATRGDILRYFQTENLLIVSVGVVAGAILAEGLNLLLMSHYEIPHLPLGYLVVGAGMLWLLGQLAVLNPAWHAANVPPVVATRSV